MPKLTHSETLILLKFIAKLQTPAMLKDLNSSPEQRERALDQFATMAAEHLAKGKHEIWRPEIDERMSFNSMRKGKG